MTTKGNIFLLWTKKYCVIDKGLKWKASLSLKEFTFFLRWMIFFILPYSYAFWWNPVPPSAKFNFEYFSKVEKTNLRVDFLHRKAKLDQNTAMKKCAYNAKIWKHNVYKQSWSKHLLIYMSWLKWMEKMGVG